MLRVRLSEGAEAELIRAAEDASPVEAGGLLLGVRVADEPWIVGVVRVSGPASSASYEIPQGATSVAMAAARETDPRLGYLGDWHSHPADVDPSRQDFRTLRGLSLGARQGHRLMAVVRRRRTGWRVEVWWRRTLFLGSHRCDIIRTGPLDGRGSGYDTGEGTAGHL